MNTRSSLRPVFVVVRDGFQKKLFLPICQRLRARDLALVLVLPPQPADFVQDLVGEGDQSEPLLRVEPGLLTCRVSSLFAQSLTSGRVTQTLRIKQRGAGSSRTPWRQALATFSLQLASTSIARRILRAILMTGLRQAISENVALIQRYCPRLLVVGSSGFNLDDVVLLEAARRCGVRIVYVITSWDHLTSKTHLLVRPYKVLAWNEFIRDEAIRYHNVLAEDIWVVGIPFSDYAVHTEWLPSRQEFQQRMGLSPQCKQITLMTVSAATYDSTALLDLILGWMNAGMLRDNCQLLVRIHSKDDFDRYERFEGLPGLVIDRPHRAPSPLWWNPIEEELRLYAAELAYSDVVITIGSTAMLEACLFDTPIISIGFEATPTVPYELSVRRYYDYNHQQNVVSTGGIRIAPSPAALLVALNTYLADPTVDRDGRQAIVRLQAGQMDGLVNERIADLILNWTRES